MKLVAREAETDALTTWLGEHPIRITSILGKVEVLRAARRAARATDDDAVFVQASAVVAAVSIA
ncbi:MAG: hypothetical protein E6J27_08445, partial [Chloroflexi bacterium]